MGPLRTLGLIDENGVPTERALDWRHDDGYPGVCEAIASEVYPDALRSAFPDPTSNMSGVVNWFARNTGAGQGAATGMAALYALLISGDIAARTAGSAAASAKPITKAASAAKIAPAVVKKSEKREQETNVDSPREVPSLNINVQIHISSDATSGQIDQIFKSMAEHLYGGR